MTEAEAKVEEEVVEATEPTKQESAEAQETTPTIEAESAGATEDKDESEGYWPADWREQVAKHASAGNEKAYERELRRLQRVTDPAAIYGNYREAEAKISSNKAIFKPGKDASEEDIKAYHKALGVPDKPEDYLENLELPHEQTIGDEDQQVIVEFAEQMHESGASQEVMNRALSWYYERQEAAAAQQDDMDERQKYEAEAELKEEYGAAYRRKTAGIASLFATAPGGPDVSNDESLYARLIGGRLADGTLVGNDPDMVRWLTSLAGDVNPAAQTLPDGMGSAKSVEDEIKDIEKVMRTDKREYFKNYAGRYAELLEARERIKARG
jgi:hypothetical protein